MGSLSNLYISQSYQSLIHLATNNTASATLIGLQDGLGNSIGVSVNTGGNLYLSGSLSASLQQGYAWVGDSNNRNTLVPTSSFGGATPAGTISSSAQITALGFVSSSVTASSLITASFSGNTLTFTKGDSSTFGVVIPDISGSTINTGSFVTTSSFNSYTASNDSKVNQLIAATGSYATTGSNIFYGNQSIASGSILRTDEIRNFPGDNLIIATDSGANIYINSNNPTTEGVHINGGLYVEQNFELTGSLTASLQQGYVWVGDASGRTTTVATSSFGGGGTIPAGTISSSAQITGLGFVSSSVTASSLVTASVNLNTITFTKGDASTFAITVNTGSGGGGSIDTGSFATTGSNTFIGNETFQDAAGNASTLVPTSGSLMLVAKTFTSSSSHITASANTFVNLIFKNNTGSIDTIVSGSNNIFTNQTSATAGFKKYVGGNGNIYLVATSIPQISGSMAFPIAMNSNYGVSLVGMRGPVSSSTWTMASNVMQGNVNIGSSAANNAEKLVSGLTLSTNSIQGTLNVVANREFLTSSATVSTNNINGVVTLNLNSSSVTFSNNIVADSGFTLTNNYYTSSLGLGSTGANRNLIIGSSNIMLATGISDFVGVTQPGFNNNILGGTSNTLFINATSASTNQQLTNTIIYGNTLIVTGSSNNSTTNGSAFFGRYNVNDGRRNSTAGTIFAVGTGTSSGVRKTGFLIDSGSNTFVEGTFNVSGSSTFAGAQTVTGSVTISGSLLSVDRSANTTNVIIGLNALGMGSAGAQPLAVGNTISIAIGNGAMRFASGSSQNVAIGNNALLITSGSNNFALGSETMPNNLTGNGNVAIGINALNQITTGASNVAIGGNAGFRTNGSNNTYIGESAANNITGSNNTILGRYQGSTGESFSNNIILADGSGNIRAQYTGSAWLMKSAVNFTTGSNQQAGTAVLDGANPGTVTVSNSLVTANSIIMLTKQTLTNAHMVAITAKSAGSFTITSNGNGDADTVGWFIINNS